jgi:L-arabinose isomerase
MLPRARIGVLFFTSGWFRDVGIQDEQTGSLTSDIERTAEQILGALRPGVDTVGGGVIFTQEQAAKAGEEIRRAGVDGLLLSPLMWCEDQIVRAALKQVPRLPILLCTFFPSRELPAYLPYLEMLKGTGSVGTLQLSGMLKREGWSYHPVTGYHADPALYEEIKEYCGALAVRRMLGRATVGVMPFRCEQMSTTYVDEFAVRSLYGVELKYLEMSRLRDAAQAVDGPHIAAFIKRLESGGAVVEVDRRNLEEGVKYAIAMERMVREEKFDVFVMNDVIEEMHRSLGLRPCLANPDLSETGAVVAMEADVGAGLAMYMLRLLTGESPFYTEALTADLEKNHLLMGHAGFHDEANSDPGYPVRIVPDVEYQNTDPFTGCCTCFKYRPGPVTVVNSVYDGERLSWTAVEGTSVEGPPSLEGTCHLVFRPDIPIREFYRRALANGVSQHLIVVHGRHLDRLHMLCDLLGIAYTPLSSGG